MVLRLSYFFALACWKACHIQTPQDHAHNTIYKLLSRQFTHPYTNSSQYHAHNSTYKLRWRHCTQCRHTAHNSKSGFPVILLLPTFWGLSYFTYFLYVIPPFLRNIHCHRNMFHCLSNNYEIAGTGQNSIGVGGWPFLMLIRCITGWLHQQQNERKLQNCSCLKMLENWSFLGGKVRWAYIWR